MKISTMPTLIIILSFTGCAQLVPNQREQAIQTDFGSIYMTFLANKYKSANGSLNTSLDEKLKKYDELEEIDLDLTIKKEDQKLKSDLDTEIDGINSSLTLSDQKLTATKSQKTVEEKSLKELKEKLANLGMSDPEAESKKEILNKEINEKTSYLSTLASEISKTEEYKALISPNLSKKQVERKNLEDKLYSSSEEKRKRIRNEIARDFLAIADNDYMNFKNSLLSGRVKSDTIADISELLLSTATTLTGGLMSKTNLGAASTLLKGSRATVDKNFFAQQTMRAIINSMEESRASDKFIINEKMKRPTITYSISEAISDVQRYQSRANLFLAVLDLANQSGKSAVKAEENLVRDVKAPVSEEKK